jgi:hypothetical protein
MLLAVAVWWWWRGEGVVGIEIEIGMWLDLQLVLEPVGARVRLGVRYPFARKARGSLRKASEL